jgi:hypothetical protein
MAAGCSKTWTCGIDGCSKRHNRWLHTSNTEKQRTDAGTGSRNVRELRSAPEEKETVAATIVHEPCKIALPIKRVLVKSAHGGFEAVYALHDSGSSSSICTKNLLQRLGVGYEETRMKFRTVNGAHSQSCLSSTLVLWEDREYQVPVVALDEISIGRGSVVTREEMEQYPHLRGLDLPAVDLGRVELLIGQDCPDLLVPLETRVGKPGEPYAVRTRLGWGISGPLNRGPVGEKEISTHFVESQSEDAWNGDQTQTDFRYSISEQEAVREWDASLSQLDGHYVMNIPFKKRPPRLPDNYSVAASRLRQLERKLERNETLKEMYHNGFKIMLAKGYCERVDNRNLMREDGFVWYLPHHGVSHPHKPEKVRLVFDCAAKYEGVSLNDRVRKGPDLTNKLFGVFLKFREEPVAFMADIEGMFNQVHVSEGDRDALRFLWWNEQDPASLPPVVYRMTTHLFGGVWSPACANYALKKTAEEFGKEYAPEVAKIVNRNFYVDDCLKSTTSASQAVDLINQLRSLLQCGGFQLTKFISNDREVLNAIPESEWSKRAKMVVCEDATEERALGVLWSLQEDCFSFEAKTKEVPPTKRGVLSMVNSMYDPCGFTAPFILPAKRIFQELCRLGLGWDEAMPSHVEEQWTRWLKDFPEVSKMKVPRCLKSEILLDDARAQLHCFCDASEHGLGAVVYLRLEDSQGKAVCSLIMAKSRLAPLKTLTIPRLELT